jgi:DNA-binding transcriptional LysR family regulator
MDFRELRVFVEVVKQGGFSAATRVLFASQPTVSKAIKQLEDEVGVQLFDRVGKKVKLTVAGDLVYRHAVAMLAARENLQNDLADLSGLRRGRIRLGLSRLGSAIMFTQVVVQFRRRYPGVEIELVERGVLALQQALQEGALDLAVCRLPVPEDLDWIMVHDEPLLALVAREHPLAAAASVELGQLADTPFILFEPGFALNAQIVTACQLDGFTPRVAAYSGQAELILALVAANVGVAFLPKLICPLANPSISCLPIKDQEFRWRRTLAWKRDCPLPPAARAFLELVRATVAGAETLIGDPSAGNGPSTRRT